MTVTMDSAGRLVIPKELRRVAKVTNATVNRTIAKVRRERGR